MILTFNKIAHSFANTTYGESSTGKTIACDQVVPAILRNFGHISWVSGKTLQFPVSIKAIQWYYMTECITTGGIAEEQHENIVYCLR